MRIILSMTTSRRLALFERTLLTLREHVHDLDCVDEILHLDDGSDDGDLQRIHGLFSQVIPQARLRSITEWRFPNRAHHACMMQTWHDLVSPADFVFHCEDDWEFRTGGNLISQALELMSADPAIGQVGFWRKPPPEQILSLGHIRYWRWRHDPAAEFIHRAQDEDDIDPAWPHFSLRPGLIRCEALRKTGNFQQERFFEHAFAKRWTAVGCTTVFLAEKCCFHQAPAKGQSVYEQAETLR